MKVNVKLIPAAIALAALGLVVTSAANATTMPSRIVGFTAEKPIRIIQTRGKSWRDSAFGDMGWTHSSGWGRFTARAGQTVQITAVSSNPELHPGISVWFRGKDDTAPNKYVADHFYAQNANQFVYGAKDEMTGEEVGNIVMKIAAYGYDQDGNSLQPPLHGKKDGISGRLRLTFKAPETGAYMFVLGGFNPGPSVDPNAVNDIKTKVVIESP